MQNETIVILMAAYNGALYIGEQIDSILCQTDENWHLTISDDGSTDGTCVVIDEYVRRYPDRVQRAYSGRRFGGAKDHFFWMTEQCDADYIAYCDDDDTWKADKLEKLRKAIQDAEARLGSDTPILVFSDQTVTDEKLNTLAPSQIPTCNILGVNIAAIDMEWLLDYLNDNIHALSGDYICVSNVHTTVTAYEDQEYCKVQNGGIMAIPDGGPLSSVGQRRGFKNMKRTIGPSLMGEIFMTSAEKGYRHYFYGSTDETLEKLYAVLLDAYPGIQIAGMYSPPFRPMTEEEDKAIVERINETKPDFVWVGLGAPKQEKWMGAHQGIVNGLMVGVGAGFDYFAGNIERAPEWMQKRNLEWVYRLLQDPKRLFGRYWHTNTKFIWNAMIRGK